MMESKTLEAAGEPPDWYNGHDALPSKPMQLRMEGVEEIPSDLVFDLNRAEVPGFYVATAGDLSFYITESEVNRLRGLPGPHWVLV